MNIHVWVDFRTDFARFDVSVEPERYIEAMEAIREFCRQHGGVITKETIRISVKEYTINDDLRIVELFKKNPEEFIKKAMETENDPDVVTREDVISKLLGRSVSVKESKIILRKKYYYHPAYVVLDGEVWYFADVKVPPTHMEELKNHFEVTDNGVTNAKRLEITLELDYGELLQVKDVVRRNGSKIKRIFELINEGLENATRYTIDEYEKLVKQMLLDGRLDELEKKLEERVKKVRKEAEARKKRRQALEEVKYEVVETPVGYLYAGSWSLDLIREEGDDIVLYSHSGSESEIAQKVYSIRNGRLPKLNVRISLKESPSKFTAAITEDMVNKLKNVAPELYLKLQLLDVVR